LWKQARRDLEDFGMVVYICWTDAGKIWEGGEKVKAKIVVPTVDDSGLDSMLAEHFGRAPYFTVIEIDEKGEISSLRAFPNTGEHAGGRGYAHDLILELKPTAVIVYGMGPRGLIGFQNAGIAVLRANADTVREVVSAYKEDRLDELTEGCHQARHP